MTAQGAALPPMSAEMRERGVTVFITYGRSEDVEDYVRALARRSGQECDWGYVAGRAVVRTLGDAAAVRQSAVDLAWMEVAMHTVSADEDAVVFDEHIRYAERVRARRAELSSGLDLVGGKA